MAKEDLNSQLIVFNDHQYILPTSSTVMAMLPKVEWQDILGESVKHI